jgi:hypothetical protein
VVVLIPWMSINHSAKAVSSGNQFPSSAKFQYPVMSGGG